MLLVIGGKGVLVKHHQFRVIRARLREVGKLRSDGRRLDSRRMRSSLAIVLFYHSDQIKMSSRTGVNSLLSSPTERDQWRTCLE